MDFFSSLLVLCPDLDLGFAVIPPSRARQRRQPFVYIRVRVEASLPANPYQRLADVYQPGVGQLCHGLHRNVKLEQPPGLQKAKENSTPRRGVGELVTWLEAN